MGNGLFNPPPPDAGASLPDIPVTDFVAQAKDTTKGQKDSHWYDFFWLAWWKSVKTGIIKVISLFVGGLDDVLAIALEGVTAAQGTGQPGMLKLMGAVMEDLLAIPIEGEEFVSAIQKGGRLGAMRRAGGKLLDVLAAEMSPKGGGVTIQPGREGASAFLGFLIEFAVREGNLAVISELIPEEFNFMGGLREYGTNLARNLGLGRLARLALRPLITTLVAEPLQANLNELYRPRGLSDNDAIKAFTEGQIDGGKLGQILIRHGYDPALHTILTSNAYKKPSLEELYALRQSTDGAINPDTKVIQLLGYAPNDANLAWAATRQSHINPLVHSYLNEVKVQFREGIIDVSQRDAILAEMPLTEDERTWWIRIMANARVSHVRHLTEQQLEHAYLEGILDLTKVQEYWALYGFTTEAIQTLSLLLLAKQRAGSRTAVGHKPVKHLSETQLDHAFKAGLMTLPAVQAYWTLLGYNPADVATLTALLTAPPPPKATPPPAAPTSP
jgi:hypothetical protein